MNTQENNKLIAEFMGLQFNKGTMYNMGYDVFADGNLYRTHELQYHTSWDWLMPVHRKCMLTPQFVGDDQLRTLLIDAVIDADIDRLYEAVVCFIQEYRLTPKEVC